MSQEKHTPGPWKQHPDYPWIIKQDNAPISEDGLSICNTTSHPDSGFFPSPSESRANSRLIAAAPELLQALIDLEAMAERYRPSGYPIPDAQKAAHAAIAKATGQTP